MNVLKMIIPQKVLKAKFYRIPFFKKTFIAVGGLVKFAHRFYPARHVFADPVLLYHCSVLMNK